MVFLGSLSIYATITGDNGPLRWMDLPAIAVTVSAILIEAFADKQLRTYILKNPGTDKTLDSGLWRISRHPNYLGEILFWWGLYLFALAANPGWWWVIVGPAAITLMFLFASIPMMEKRMMERRKDYKEYCKKVPVLLPFGRRE
jgi:steroid 5-alpha reductase family enzyme